MYLVMGSLAIIHAVRAPMIRQLCDAYAAKTSDHANKLIEYECKASYHRRPEQ